MMRQFTVIFFNLISLKKIIIFNNTIFKNKFCSQMGWTVFAVAVQ